jgi:hypothetical protein
MAVAASWRFVDMDVATCLQHGERSGEPADAAADYCYLETHPKISMPEDFRDPSRPFDL